MCERENRKRGKLKRERENRERGKLKRERIGVGQEQESGEIRRGKCRRTRDVER